MRISRQELALAIGLVGAALLGGWLAGAFGWAFFTGAAVWIFVQLRERERLVEWSRRPLQRPPAGLDPTPEITARLFRALKRNRDRHWQTINTFKRLRTLTDALPDAAIIIDATGNIETLNPAAQRLLRLKADDRGNHLSSLVRQPAFAALTKGQIDSDLIELTSPFSDDVRLEARRIPMPDGGHMILVRDVTELNRLLSMRQDFIANVSHELRTPLTVIVGYIETLLNEDLDQETLHGLVSKLRSPTTRMRALVDDLLLLTRLESSPNPRDEELASVDMGVIINAISADARMLSGDRHDIQTVHASNARVRGIESELHSACLNLVTNAVRYSPDGGEIRIAWEPVSDGVRFAVSDQGMGIPREHLPRITERFYRVDLAQSRVRGGTGLGLAIVKHVLKRHNTHLQVTSELAKGSTFFCVFPPNQLNCNT